MPKKVYGGYVESFVTKFVILICQSLSDQRSNNCSFKGKGNGCFQN